MKKFFSNTLKLFLALGAVALTACQEFDIDSQPEAPANIQIDALDSYTVLATSPSNVVFNISSNTPWSITSDQQWCTPTPSMSASSSLVSEIVVSMEDNIGKQSRTATLTITADEISTPKVITIVQASKENLVVIPYDELVATEGETISFTLVSNKAWEIIPSTGFLADINKTSGTGDENGTVETITINVPANAGAKREGTITVKTDYEEYTFTIEQNGVIIELADGPENTTFTMGGVANENTFVIRSNKEWKVEVPKEYQAWLSAEKVSDTELKVSVTTNNLMVARKGQLIMKTVEVIDGFDGVTFDVSQSRAFWLNGSASNFVTDEETGYMTVYNGGIASNYLFKKGHLTFEFESINITSNNWIEFNMWTDYGKQPNFHVHFKPDVVGNFTCGGGLNWTQKTFTWTTEQINAVRKVEFYVIPKEDNPEYLILKFVVDGVEVAVLDNNIKDCYLAGDDANYPGQTIWLKLNSGDGTSNFVVKSITCEPIE